MSIITDIRLLKNRRTKILATLGPASQEPGMIRKLIESGVNVFRLNMSHGTHEFHRTTYNHIRNIAEELNSQTAVLADLCGPKIRTGKFSGGQITLEKDAELTVTTRDVQGKPGLIPSQYRELANDVVKNNRILLNDGNLELKVLSVEGTEIRCKVVHGGILKNHKGINLPGVKVSAPSLTEKDKEDALFALELGVDFLALSFVRHASDIDDLKKIITGSNSQFTRVIAKIEKPEALEDIDSILDTADGIMVARGDLGVELNPEQVPVAQGQLIEIARQKFKPVIVATQMLESMIEHARPTRAEVTDISYAVALGTDAVMLSAESAAGEFPLESVQMMDRIIRQTEAYLWKSNAYDKGMTISQARPVPVWQAVSNVTNDLARYMMVRGIVVLSKSGMSAITMSAARPNAPVVAISDHKDVCRRLSLLWGIIPIYHEKESIKNLPKMVKKIAVDIKLAEPGDPILLVRGFSSVPEKNTPSVTVLTV